MCSFRRAYVVWSHIRTCIRYEIHSSGDQICTEWIHYYLSVGTTSWGIQSQIMSAVNEIRWRVVASSNSQLCSWRRRWLHFHCQQIPALLVGFLVVFLCWKKLFFSTWMNILDLSMQCTFCHNPMFLFACFVLHMALN